MKYFTEIKADEFNSNIIKLIGSNWMLITAGSIENYNTMTASWGGIGHLWNLPVALIFIRPQRYTYKYVEEYKDFTLSFFDNKYRSILNYCGENSGKNVNKIDKTGLIPLITDRGNITFKQASITIECLKIYFDDIKKTGFLFPNIDKKIYPAKDYHRMYIGKIEHIFIK